jgi:hypothetical protein
MTLIKGFQTNTGRGSGRGWKVEGLGDVGGVGGGGGMARKGGDRRERKGGAGQGEVRGRNKECKQEIPGLSWPLRVP